MTAAGDTPILRFAPSPNGQLHLGHALSALTGFDMARRLGGRFLVRIEDIDTARCTQAHIASQLEDLAWLGLTWEEPVLRQSQHFGIYSEAAARLEDLGLLYPCFATRQDIAAAKRPNAVDPDGAPIYPGLHKHMPQAEIAARKQRGEPFALRLDMERAIEVSRERLAGAALTFTSLAADGTTQAVRARPERWGDTIVVRKDVPSSYHLSVVVDDARQARHPRHPRHGPVRRDRLASATSSSAGPAGPALSSPPADNRRGGPQTRQKRARYQFGQFAAGGHHSIRNSTDDWPAAG